MIPMMVFRHRFGGLPLGCCCILSHSIIQSNPHNRIRKIIGNLFMRCSTFYHAVLAERISKRILKILKLTNKDLKNRKKFSKYMYKLHNIVNKMLNKKNYLTYSDVRDRYENFRSRCTTTKRIKIVSKKKLNMTRKKRKRLYTTEIQRKRC